MLTKVPLVGLLTLSITANASFDFSGLGRKPIKQQISSAGEKNDNLTIEEEIISSTIYSSNGIYSNQELKHSAGRNIEMIKPKAKQLVIDKKELSINNKH